MRSIAAFRSIKPGSIQHYKGRVDFIIEQEGKSLPVSYVGRDPLPDTFVDGAQALVEGKHMPNGQFLAEKVQAKCASKYEAVPGQKPGKPGYGTPTQQEHKPTTTPAVKKS